VGEANHELRVQRAIGDYTIAYGRLVKGEGVTVVLRDLVDECVAVAKADGVTLPGDVDAAVRKIAETAAGQYSSTAQDLARGKRSEDRSSERLQSCGVAKRWGSRRPPTGCFMRSSS